jgi:predicted signal transduction protein with EAL and GGDEF domain
MSMELPSNFDKTKPRMLGLFNTFAGRALFTEQVMETLDAMGRQPKGPGFAVLAFQLDRYSIVSDTMGFDAADLLTKTLARRLLNATGPGTRAAHLGDAEYGVILDNITGEDQALARALTLQAELNKPCDLLGTLFHVNLSAGLAVANPAYTHAERLVTDALAALHDAHRTRPGGLKVYSDSLLLRRSQELSMDSELREALMLGQISPHFQPLVSLADGRAHGFEALARWVHPELGFISPAKFIPIAEETGLIRVLGSLMLDQALEHVAQWRKSSLSTLFVSVNVAAEQLATETFVDEVMLRLRDHGLPPDALHLEITESIMVANPERARGVLQALSDKGVRISLDDFGTGYSSFSSLHQFPIHTLKIDRSLVPKNCEADRQRQLFDALCTLAAKLGLEVVVEGVETQDQAGIVRLATPGLGQGFLWSKALPPDQVEAWMVRSGN